MNPSMNQSMNPSINQQPETFISKYKPYHIADFCTDSKFKSMLKTLLDIDDLNILFIGNASSGKTTLLYAMIREYYGLTKTQSIPEHNIMFVNNLKEQGINFYRNEMKTFAQSHSNIYGKKKMIIIDDIDMINEQSQQVFRNYIDKYKHNIHFISVCTNIQKVIESIQSRVHILRVNIPDIGQIRNILDKIVENEQIVMDEESKNYLLKFSNNSIRTVITNLEKIYILGCPVSIDICRNLCSDISHRQFENYIEHMKLHRLNDAIKVLYAIHDYGYSVIDIYDYLFTFIKQTDMLTEDEKYKMIPVLCKYITIFHNIHEDIIELALFSKELYLVL
jgi:DNA polymerase III delta prime subunit